MVREHSRTQIGFIVRVRARIQNVSVRYRRFWAPTQTAAARTRKPDDTTSC